MDSIYQAIKRAVAENRMRVQTPTDIEAADHIWAAVQQAMKAEGMILFDKPVTTAMLDHHIKTACKFEEALAEVAQELNEALGNFDYAESREEAGKALLFAVYGLKGDEKVIGNYADLQIVIRSAFGEGKRMVLRGGIDYEAGRAETPIGYVKVLEHTLNRMNDVLAAEREYLSNTEKRMAGIQSELARPFDKAERLTWLQQRQKEIDAMLDLSKGDLQAADEAETSEAA